MRKFSHALDNADHAQAPACMACQNDRARYRNCDPLNQGRAEATELSLSLARAKLTQQQRKTNVQNQEKRRDVASVV
jgi:hypothetical protein